MLYTNLVWKYDNESGSSSKKKVVAAA
jgi:hypothetical protein